MGLSLIVQDLNAISETTVMLCSPDGLERESYVMLAGTIQDQQELDRLCCEGAQHCKQCTCTKEPLHDAYARFPLRISKDVEKASAGTCNTRISKDVQHIVTVHMCWIATIFC